MCKLTVPSLLFGSLNVCRPLKQYVSSGHDKISELKCSQVIFKECPNITDLTALLVLMYHSDKISVIVDM